MALPDWAVGVNSVILTIALVGGLAGAIYLNYWEYAATIVSLYMTLMSFLVGGAIIYERGKKKGREECYDKMSEILGNTELSDSEALATLLDMIIDFEWRDT